MRGSVIVQADEAPFIAIGDAPVAVDVSTEEQAGLAYRMLFPGDADSLQLFEVQCQPNLRVQPHAHEEDEIIFVVDGELRLGATAIGPGGAVYLKGRTVYGFVAGPSGCRFLNIRGREDVTYYSPAVTRQLGPKH